jgi:hypothetical protein
MKNLKKLTRKGLDELANEMPQVNELQQQECVGGDAYINCGDYVPFLADGDDFDMKVCLINNNLNSAVPMFSHGNTALETTILDASRYIYATRYLFSQYPGTYVYLSGVVYGEYATPSFSGGILYLQFAEGSSPDYYELNSEIIEAYENAY